MNIRIGDIVRFISDKLEGKVTGIIDNNTVNVYCEEYGFEIPASVNNPCRDSLGRETDKRNILHSRLRAEKRNHGISRHALRRVRTGKLQQPDGK